MPKKPKYAGDVLGVRPRIWAGLTMAILGTMVFFRLMEIEEAGPRSANGPGHERLDPIVHTPAPPGVAAGSFLSPISEPTVETVPIVTEVRENEPVAALINGLFAPDPQMRMTAALRLSRRSLYAVEAVPVLKKLAPEEPDPKVREVMKEAILNIRGYVPPPFETMIKK